MDKVKAYLVSGKVSSNSLDAYNLFEKERFGERVGEKVVYSIFEVVYLMESGKLELLDSKGKKVSLEKAIKLFEKLDKKFMNKFIIFRDLRKKGNIVKGALKFGSEFRVYEKGSKLGEDHAKWIILPISEHEKLNIKDFCAKNRIAHSTKKDLLVAVVDDEEDVSYYEARWMKL